MLYPLAQVGYLLGVCNYEAFKMVRYREGDGEIVVRGEADMWCF